MAVRKTLWERIQVDSSDGCWMWIGKRHPKGYGVVPKRVDEPQGYAHRRVYEELVGPIPEGMTLDHRCRVRSCVNPAHLEPVTNAENVRRGLSTRLTVGDVRHVMAHPGLGAGVLATRLGVTRSTIEHVRAGRTWADVTGAISPAKNKTGRTPSTVGPSSLGG